MSTTYPTAVSREQQSARSATIHRSRPGLLLPAFSLWWREIVRFYRMPTRVVGVIASPVMFWLVLGSGFGRSFGNSAQSYLEYFFPGALVMIVLFTSIFAMMSVIEDRRAGFLLSVLVAPVSRASIVLGKVLGGTTLGTLQGVLFLLMGPLIGVPLPLSTFVLAFLTIWLIAFSLTALGFAVAWRMDSAQGFHAVVNMFLIPLWLLSGAVFPFDSASGWLQAIMRANPLTYGMDALRLALFSVQQPGFWNALAILAVFSAGMFGAALWIAGRRKTLPT